MDSKNDDSAGSDSLDKSLQRKCVVDDVDQAEGTSPEHGVIERTADVKIEDTGDQSSSNSKTEPYVGDVGVAERKSNSVFGDQSSSNIKTESFVGDGGVAEVKSNIVFHAENATENIISATLSESNPNHKAFESKVKQISQDLKETTLAENTIDRSIVDETSSSISPTTSRESGATVSCSSSQENSNCHAAEPELDISPHSLNESLDEHDHRSKKVRFHPDVKENDGGNRVISKKKKKARNSQNGEDCSSGNQRYSSTEEEMDLDEEEEIEEEEEEFDMVKTMSEAADYLKSHPLTFVHSHDKTAHPPKNGLLEEEDVKEMLDVVPEVHFVEQAVPENGIQRILGKHVRCGKSEFLVCYADRTKLVWETEEFILKNCPNLLHNYEQNREVRQERLMVHVANRQNVRQRYTDF